MKQFYCYDKNGFYLPGADYLADEAAPDSTEQPPVSAEGRGLYRAKYADGQWTETGTAPPFVPLPPSVPEELGKLKKQIRDLEDMVVYLTMPEW